jgi:hypothetical protein
VFIGSRKRRAALTKHLRNAGRFYGETPFEQFTPLLKRIIHTSPHAEGLLRRDLRL